MLGRFVTYATLMTLAVGPAPEAGWAAAAVATVFDPAWSVVHSRAIWTVIVTVLFLSGVGLPLPEDIPLTLAGFATFKQAGEAVILSRFVLTFVIVVVPILLGDMIAYGMGRRFGLDLRERVRILRRLLSDRRLERVQRWFDSYGAFTVFLGRQVAGVRFVTFFTAGSMRLPFTRFVLFDFLGCLVSVPVWLTLGVLASRYGQQWLDVAMRRVSSGFMLGALIVFGLLVLFTRVRRNRVAPPFTLAAATAAKRMVKVPEKSE